MHLIPRTLRERDVHRSTRPVRLTLVLAPLLVLGIVAAGCGDDDSEDARDGAGGDAAREDTSDNASDTANSDSLSAAGGDASGAAGAEVVAVDYHFEGLPERIDAGSRLSMHNESTVEVHELVAMAIPEEETRSAEELTALPEDELLAAVPGEPALVMVAPPGEDAVPVLGDGTLEAGRYLLLCAIPTGADPDEFMRQAQSQAGPPDVAGGPPHFTAGMYAELVVD